MRRKLKEAAGLTLVEMLAAVAVLILLGLILNTGMQMAVGSYRTMIARSEVELLLSTLADALGDDLRYAQEVETDADGKLKTYQDASGDTVGLVIGPDGQAYAGDKRVLPPGAYGRGAYAVKTMDISFAEADSCFTVELKVGQKTGEISDERTFTVRCLNPYGGTPEEGETTP